MITDTGKRIVLGAHSPGLGDNLLYSRLPELFHMDGYKVFYSKRKLESVRNPEIAEFVWKTNPFIQAFVDEDPYEPRGTQEKTHEGYVALAQHYSPLEAMGILYFEGYKKKWWESKTTPYVNRSFAYLPKWQKVYVCDLKSVSQAFSVGSQVKFLEHFAQAHGIRKEEIVTIGTKTCPPGPLVGSIMNKVYTADSIWEYADIIANAAGFACTESGPQSLSVAVRPKDLRPAWVLMTTQSYNDRLFVYPQNHYVITSEMTPDYIKR